MDVGRFVACFLAIAWVTTGYAAPLTDFEGPFQITDAGTAFLIEDGTYVRDLHPYVGGRTQIFVFDGANPSHGDAWLTQVGVTEDGAVLGTATITYDAALDCLLFESSPVFCGVFVEPGSTRLDRYILTVFFDVQCLPTDNYFVAGRFNGTLVGGSPFDFRPTDFVLGRIDLSVDRPVIAPEVPPSEQDGVPQSRAPRIPAGTTGLFVSAYDGLDCNRLVRDATVTVTTTVVPASGSHLHFNTEGIHGTGQWDAILPDSHAFDAADPHNLTFTVTMPLGLAVAEYIAGIFGVKERFTATGQNPFHGTISAHTELKISVGADGENLVPLAHDHPSYILAGSGTSLCDVGHNDSAETRRSHYLRPLAHRKVHELADAFLESTGLRLSFNDASLEYGGFFDAGGSDREDTAGNRCHTYHREGVDIDVNRATADIAACSNLHQCLLSDSSFPKHTRAISELEKIAVQELGGYRWRERNPERIHFRFVMP